MRLDKPTSLSEALQQFLDRYPHQKKLRQGMVLAKWGDVVGPKIAEQTHDLYFQGEHTDLRGFKCGMATRNSREQISYCQKAERFGGS